MSVEQAAPPEWFTQAIAQPRESRFVEVENCRIHYLRWGDPKRPGLLFVPASGGHAHWFAHLAPLFADQFCVAAIDLAGCGDSARRETYTHEAMIAEIMAVCSDSGMLAADAPLVLIGHSAGAQQAVRAAIANDEKLLGVIAVDGLRYDRELAKDQAIKILEGPRPKQEPRAPKVYETLEDAAARFRLTPAPLMPVGHQYIVDHIARNSFREVEGGWVSKYDTAQVALVNLAFDLTGRLKDLKCAAASLYSEYTHLADERAGNAVTAMNDGKVTAFTIPGTSHYPIIDSPFAFVAAIKGIVLTWLAEAKRAKA